MSTASSELNFLRQVRITYLLHSLSCNLANLDRESDLTRQVWLEKNCTMLVCLDVCQIWHVLLSYPRIYYEIIEQGWSKFDVSFRIVYAECAYFPQQSTLSLTSLRKEFLEISQLLLPDASRLATIAADTIRWMIDAKRLTASECIRLGQRQTEFASGLAPDPRLLAV